MFSTEDVAGALKDLKDEIPKLKATHTRVMEHFQKVDKTDIDACILMLKDEAIRQQFEIDFRKFAKQMDIIMPDVAAQPYLNDLKLLGKNNHGAKNLYRDSQLNMSGVGEKVRKLIDEHIYSTGVDPKIPPVDLLSGDFKEKLNDHKSGKAKASEIEHAIKHLININLDDDSEYYKSLSEKLKAILEKTHENWGKQLELLMEFRDSIATEHQKKANDLGLSETEFAFYNILIAEIIRITGNESIDVSIHNEIKQVVNDLVAMLDKATEIVNFFDKQDEIKSVKRNIKRRILDTSFDDTELRKVVMDRFMELAKVKFK